MLHRVRTLARGARDYLRLPSPAKRERLRDSRGLPHEDAGIARTIEAATAWLGRAQDCSTTRDGGVARHFSLIDGWSASYPETTGYIIPTMLDGADRTGDPALRERARRMLDWLVSIQFAEGGFQGGTADVVNPVPVTFNTGQILLGLARGARELGAAYDEPMRRAADWLVRTQDPDGCWRRHPTPFAHAGEKAYETHVAWGLFEAARTVPDSTYADAALANVRWALTNQRANGWFAQCCLSDATQPLTHTLGYALRGVIEAYRFTGDRALLDASRTTADGLIGALRDDGYLPGRLDHEWRGRVRWACLTGSVQIAHCWLLLFHETGDPRYRDAAFNANAYVRRTVRVNGPPDLVGGVKGSFPINGGYGTYTFLNWACKFFIDANLMEQAARATMGE